jgi:hypothetical protein
MLDFHAFLYSGPIVMSQANRMFFANKSHHPLIGAQRQQKHVQLMPHAGIRLHCTQLAAYALFVLSSKLLLVVLGKESRHPFIADQTAHLCACKLHNTFQQRSCNS